MSQPESIRGQAIVCDSPIWDLDYTWHSSEPKFTQCFRDTILIWIPTFILLLASIHHLYLVKRTKLLPIKWNKFNITRLTVTTFLVLLKFIQTISELLITYKEFNDDKVNINLSYRFGSLIQFFSYLILLTIYLIQKRVGLNSNGFVWFYQFSLIICEGFRYYAIFTYSKFNRGFVYELTEYPHYPSIFILFILECYGDEPNIPTNTINITDNRSKQSPEIRASFCSKITFQWVTQFIWFGFKNKIQEETLWKTIERDQSSLLVPIFVDHWANKPVNTDDIRNDDNKIKKTYKGADGKRYKRNHVFMVLFQIGWLRFMRAAILKLGYVFFLLTGPMVLKLLIKYMKSSDPEWHGILIALLFLLIPSLQSFFIANYFFHMQIMGLHIRSMIMGAVYRKSFLLSGAAREQSTSGELVNLMAVDSQRFQDLLLYINLIWSAPLQIILAIVLLYRELGWPIFAGVAAMLLILPLIAIITRFTKLAQHKLLEIKDERIKQINELLSGIRVIKLYSWENSFIGSILGFRDKELTYIRKIYKLDAIHVFLWNAAPLIVSVCAFTVYIMTDKANMMDAEKAFVSLSLFAILRFPITMLPQLINTLVMTLVSAKRINRFLNSDELVRYVIRDEQPNNDSVISIQNGCLSWINDKPTNNYLTTTATNATLSDINLKIKKGSFTAIVGQVGSGKSSLISGILGELNHISGQFNIDKSCQIAYVPQEAWLQNMSLRDNILFGNDFDQEKYDKVLNACSLMADLDSLAGRDESEIGQNGINISGGQKQRVSLARACYSDSDIYLLDDPLSALDSHVAKHVFNEVLNSKTGLLREKTRLLATNNLFVLPYVDHIVVLQQGKIVESGSFDDLINKSGILAEFMRIHQINQRDESSTKPSNGTDSTQDDLDSRDQKPKTTSTLATETEIGGRTAKSLPAEQSGKLIETERMETGSVSFAIYFNYFKAVSYRLLIITVLALVAAAAFNVGTSLWLSVWSNDAEDPEKKKDQDLRTWRLLGYATLVGCSCLSLVFAALTLARGVVRASNRIHANLLQGVMHSPMLFFDTTPMGRIVNRFAKDIDGIDSVIPGCLRSFVTCMLQVVSSLLLVCITYPKLLFIFVPLALVYYIIQKIFIVTTRQLKRLESTTRSPIFSNFSETLSGMSSIRAYDCKTRFVSNSDELVDLNNSCSLANVIANRWLSLRLEFLGNLITTSAAMFSVFNKSSVTPGLVGLVVSYSSNITQYLSWVVRMTSDLETNIVSVERVVEYSQNKPEDDWIKAIRPDRDWPQRGKIDIENFSARYRQDTALVLSNITVNIRPGEKVGILGRTGSGKSSLSLSLFRILEAASGTIKIDGKNISQFGLHDVRSKLTIIPQDPVLFSGTLRFNLDPLRLYTDYEIWNALELAHLRAHINTLESGLDHKVSEFGENFSLGQRQLICLARAILRRSKILVLDEATASVDMETDRLVQKTIREVFSDCTIITIAHRIHTILDSDRILVLDQGNVKELDEPRKLIANPNSAFVSLLHDAGIDETKVFADNVETITKL